MVSLGRHIRDLGEGFASHRLRAAFRRSLGLIVFLYPFGIAFVAGGLLPDRFSWTASVVIALNGIVVLLSEFRFVPVRAALRIFGFLVAALFIVEYVGSQTGVPFGRYTYTDVLGARILGVPPVIAIAWYGTVVCGWRIIRGSVARPGPWWTAVLAGVLAVALDVVLEPVAAEVERYWIWDSGHVPLQNYLAWFAFTVVAVRLLEVAAPARSDLPPGLVKSALLIFGMQWTLFVITNLTHGMTLKVLASVLLLGVVRLASRPRHGPGKEGIVH
jgi:putative membrane protein